MSFEARWRTLAAQARAAAPSSSALPADLAARARARPAEPLPWLGARAACSLAAASLLASGLLLGLLTRDAHDDLAHTSSDWAVPPPPDLPAPPSVASPEQCLAVVRDTWKELSP